MAEIIERIRGNICAIGPVAGWCNSAVTFSSLPIYLVYKISRMCRNSLEPLGSLQTISINPNILYGPIQCLKARSKVHQVKIKTQGKIKIQKFQFLCNCRNAMSPSGPNPYPGICTSLNTLYKLLCSFKI